MNWLKKNQDTGFKITAIFLISIAALFVFFCTLGMDTRFAPDEMMRYEIGEFIYNNNHLPWGDEPELITPWGFNYSFSPYFPTLIGVLFMKLAGLSSDNWLVLLSAFRQVSTLCVIGTGIYAYLIAKRVFVRYGSRTLFMCLSLFLPQFLYLGSYFNNDIFSCFLGFGFTYCWICGIKDGWNWKNCIHLGILCGVMSITYYFGYAWILGSLIVFLVSAWKQKKNPSWLWKRTGAIFLIAFAIGGWFFIKNAVFEPWDFLGLKATMIYQERFGQDLNLFEPFAQGYSLSEMLFKPVSLNGNYMVWMKSFIVSYIGMFASMSIRMSMKYYVFYLGLLGLGSLIGLILCVREFMQKRDQRPLLIGLGIALILPFFLSIFNSYFNDYQPQGRYMIANLCPLMLLTASGYNCLSLMFSEIQQRIYKQMTRKTLRITLSLSLIIGLFFAYKGVQLYYNYNSGILFENVGKVAENLRK